MEGDRWQKNQLLQILENDEYLKALLHRHQDIYGALQEIIDRFDVKPHEETEDLLQSLRLIWQQQFLEEDYNLLSLMESFLDEQKEEVTRQTWKRYLHSLQLFYNYLSEYGELDVREISWQHVEEFLSWWYLRHHIQANKRELTGIFPTLKKFFSFLEGCLKKGDSIWKKKAGESLRKDLMRIMDWEIARSNYFFHEEDGDEEYCWEGYFQVIMARENRLGLLDINMGEKIMVNAEKTFLTYLRIGDIFSATILIFDAVPLLLDEDIFNLYPPQALPYIR